MLIVIVTTRINPKTIPSYKYCFNFEFFLCYSIDDGIYLQSHCSFVSFYRILFSLQILIVFAVAKIDHCQNLLCTALCKYMIMRMPAVIKITLLFFLKGTISRSRDRSTKVLLMAKLKVCLCRNIIYSEDV